VTSDPAKARAHSLVARAIAKGELVRQPCELCGDFPTEAHHEDYSKPLEVLWVCGDCHRSIVHEKRTRAAQRKIIWTATLMKLAKPELYYEGTVAFFKRLGITFRYGMKLVNIDVLEPDALCGGKPVFLVDGESLNRHRAEILNYQSKRKHIEQNVLIHA
jgi:hypothetical protein